MLELAEQTGNVPAIAPWMNDAAAKAAAPIKIVGDMVLRIGD
jgi:hypothetical protein